jgi:predicted nucleic acid-binding Zn ribbon protein
MNRLSDALGEALRRLDNNAGLEARAVMLWSQIVGPQMAAASEVRSVQDGTLVVVTRSSAWSQEFSFQKRTILRRYREKLGQEFIRDLRFTVGAVRGISDPAANHAPPDAEVRRIRLSPVEVASIRRAADTGDPELAQAIRRSLTHEAQIRHWHLEHGARPCSRCGAAFRTPRDLCPACLQDEATRDSPL